jgi:hypothetical protein
VSRGCLPGSSGCSVCNPSPVYCQGCLRVKVEDVRDLCEECEDARAEEESLCPYCPATKSPDEHTCGSSECLAWLASDMVADDAEDDERDLSWLKSAEQAL